MLLGKYREKQLGRTEGKETIMGFDLFCWLFAGNLVFGCYSHHPNELKSIFEAQERERTRESERETFAETEMKGRRGVLTEGKWRRTRGAGVSIQWASFNSAYNVNSRLVNEGRWTEIEPLLSPSIWSLLLFINLLFISPLLYGFNFFSVFCFLIYLPTITTSDIY